MSSDRGRSYLSRYVNIRATNRRFTVALFVQRGEDLLRAADFRPFPWP